MAKTQEEMPDCVKAVEANAGDVSSPVHLVHKLPRQRRAWVRVQAIIFTEALTRKTHQMLSRFARARVR